MTTKIVLAHDILPLLEDLATTLMQEEGQDAEIGEVHKMIVKLERMKQAWEIEHEKKCPPMDSAPV